MAGMFATPEVWCLLINNNRLVIGKPFPLSVDQSVTVGHLKQLVRECRKNRLQNVDADALEIIQSKKSRFFADRHDTKHIEGCIATINFDDEDQIARPLDGVIVLNLGLDIAKAEILLVQVRGHSLMPSSLNETFDNEEKCIRLLCRKYWGKGDEGWKSILRTERITVPHLAPHSDEAPKVEVETSSDSEATTSPVVQTRAPIQSTRDANRIGESVLAAETSDQGSEVSYDYISLGPDIKGFFPVLSDMALVRQEYLEVVKALEKLYESKVRGVVLTGRPGIGKSMFLFYLLIYRILLGKPTAFQSDDSRTFLITGPSSIRIFPKDKWIEPDGFPGAWALTDSNSSLITPRGEFVNMRSEFFLIQATPPQPTRWKAWSKQLCGHFVVMNQWSWEEVYIAGMKFAKPGSVMNAETLRLVFTKTGGSVRQCLELTLCPKALVTWERDLDQQFQSLPGPSVIQLAYHGIATGIEDDNLLKISSNIVAPVPGNLGGSAIDFVSRYITDRYYEVVLRNNPQRFWEYFNLFWRIRPSHDSAGWLWEDRIISEWLQGQPDRNHDMKLRRLDHSGSRCNSTPPPAEKQRSIPKQLRLPHTCVATHGDMKSLSALISLHFPSIKSGNPLLFVPSCRNQVTFDAFSVSAEGLVTIFQPSVRGTHSINASGLEFILDALSDAGKNIPDIKRLLPTQMDHWRIVFVIPRRIEGQWTTTSSIDFKGVKPKRKWEDYIEQFVVAVEDS